ncbi:helicase [Streptomyces violaceusniger]|uniref:UvrD-helicase domain-containing protein n=2 Tax=Streptomyces violaceusniger group TaxID=2839105 RepID=A0ABD5J1U7_9ACTN|nr:MULTISPECIES: UvrD-helicase domain-containing protein [Streptomyces]KUL60660.1 helicase [Streptomyces violaceusniger]MEE4582345.1 UvrD-helicase domain-containing protein [Streptomyces sp. DSM 41602]WTA87111.1 UvrD-helicase domain-containing protein [Streptomyces antimycoticus]WTB11647.1 UvrD-helicase domain-containing protein [Streptomyces antimycoticus]
MRIEQTHLDRVYHRLEEKIHEAEFLMDDAAKRGQVGTPGALAERDAQVFRAGVHLNRLNSEFEDFLFGRIDLLPGKDGERGPDGAYTSVEPADDAIRTGPDGDRAEIAETLHIGRIGVLDADYAPLVIDWRAPAAAPFYRSTPVAPGRVVRRRVIRSKGRRVLGVEDDLLRPELSATLDGSALPVVGDGALMAALGQARGHTMRDIVASIQAEQDQVIRAPAASITEVEGGPGTGKTAVALHRAAYLLYQDRRRYAGGILVVSPTPLLVAYTEGVLPSLGEEGQVAIRAVGSLVEGAEATTYDTPAVARVKGSSRMLRVLRKAARGALEMPRGAAAGSASTSDHPSDPSSSDDGRPTLDAALGALATTPSNDGGRPGAGSGTRPGGPPERLRVVAFGARIELDADELRRIRQNVLGGTAPVNLLRPRARRLLLDALWSRSGAPRRYTDPELAAEAREGFDEDISSEDVFQEFLDAWWPELTPRSVLAAMADEKRLGRWSRRVLNPREVRQVARSLARLGPDGQGPLSVHDVALLDELNTLLGLPARPAAPREVDPLDQLTGLEELTTYADRVGPRRSRADRAEQERTDYAHVIVDEAQDLTPMQWRMVGRRGRHATWTVVGDPAQSSWSDPDEAGRARDEALGSRPRRRFTLTVNYRNPSEIAELATRVLTLAMPGTPAPEAVRSTGVEPRFAPGVDGDLGAAARREALRLLDEVEGTVGVVVAMNRREQARQWLTGLGHRVVALGSLEAKGLEYDATVVVSPAEIADESPAGLRVLYVALTRATQRLTVVSGARDEPDPHGVPDLLRE